MFYLPPYILGVSACCIIYLYGKKKKRREGGQKDGVQAFCLYSGRRGRDYIDLSTFLPSLFSSLGGRGKEEGRMGDFPSFCLLPAPSKLPHCDAKVGRARYLMPPPYPVFRGEKGQVMPPFYFPACQFPPLLYFYYPTVPPFHRKERRKFYLFLYLMCMW